MQSHGYFRVMFVACLTTACGGGGEDTDTTTSMVTGVPTTGSSTDPETTDESSGDPTTEGPTTTGPTTDPTTDTTETTEATTQTTDTTTETTEATTDETTDASESDSDSETTGPPPPLNIMCLITHNGGSPATASVVELYPDGGLGSGETIELPGGHSPATTDYRREGVVTCGGRYAHFALLDDSLLATYEVGYTGELTPVGEPGSVPNIEGLLCIEEHNVLVAFGRSGPMGYARSFVIEEDGTRTPGAEIDLSFKYQEDLQLYATVHPKQNLLYFAGATTGPGNQELEVHAINYGNNGQLVPNDLTETAGNLFFGLHIAPSGDEMAFTSYNGVLAWHNLPPSGDVPQANQLTLINGVEWQSGVDMVIRTDPSSDENFYYAQTSGGTGTIRVAEFLGDQVMFYDAIPAPGKRSHLKLAYEDDILLAISQGGDIRSWEVDSEGVVLTEAHNIEVSGAPQASTLIPCSAP